jgi:phage host-nuclease inhibitor protein Gam
MNELKKEADFERTNENANLRKEIADLKEVIDRMESKQMEELSSTTSIEYRVQMERMKKEL